MTQAKKTEVPGSRAPRQDGRATRRCILEAAGRVFAERGYADATSKEICAAARANSAAVNYYFGSKENLYREVLIAAHEQLIAYRDIEEISYMRAGPEEKLRALFAVLLRVAASPAERWGIKVFLRELTAPSQAIRAVLPGTVLPKAEMLSSLVGELGGLPPEAPEVQRGVAFVVLPCISMILFPEELRTKILPAVDARDETLLDDMLRYAVGGVKALAVK